MKRFNRRHAFAALGASLAMPYVRPSWARAAEVAVLNRADHIGETTLEEFEAATGIGVRYQTYDRQDEIARRQGDGFDLVVQPLHLLPAAVAAGQVQLLDPARLSGWQTLDPGIVDLCQGCDPGNRYGLPYLWGQVGLTYDMDRIGRHLPDADLASLDTILGPDNAAALAAAGGIALPDDLVGLTRMILAHLGRPASDLSDLRSVANALGPVRGHMRHTAEGPLLAMAGDGAPCVAVSRAGDCLTARSRAVEAGWQANLTFAAPRTGAAVWVDVLTIPTGAQNIEQAYAFLDFLLRPSVMAACTTFTGHANSCLTSQALMDPALGQDPTLWPDAADRRALLPPYAPSAQEMAALASLWRT